MSHPLLPSSSITASSSHGYLSFYYLTGADVPGCAVTYDIGADSLILWAPRSDPRSVLWYGKFPTPDQYLAASDLDLVLNVQSVTTYLRSALTNPKNTLYVLSDDQAPNLSFPEDLIRARFDTTLLKPAMDRARVIKTEHEIALIRRANAISVGPFPLNSLGSQRLLTHPFPRAAPTKPSLTPSLNAAQKPTSTPSTRATASPATPRGRRTRPSSPAAPTPAPCTTPTTTSRSLGGRCYSLTRAPSGAATRAT